MSKFRCSVVWQESGTIIVEDANTWEEAMEKAHEAPLPKSDGYVDDSFEIDVVWRIDGDRKTKWVPVWQQPPGDPFERAVIMRAVKLMKDEYKQRRRLAERYADKYELVEASQQELQADGVWDALGILDLVLEDKEVAEYLYGIQERDDEDTESEDAKSWERQIQMGVAWADGSWERIEVMVPATADQEEMERVGRKKILDLVLEDMPAVTGAWLIGYSPSIQS